MKLIFAVLASSACITAMAADWRPLETNYQARQRQSAENYDTYRRSNSMLPPTYDRPLGEPQQRGVERPGYVSPSPAPQPAYGGSWQDRAKDKRW